MNRNKLFLFLIFILFIIIFVGSIILFPEWRDSMRTIVVLVMVAIVSIVAFIADLQSVFNFNNDQKNDGGNSKILLTFLQTIQTSIEQPTVIHNYLHQIPLAPKDFSGRKNELIKLHNFVDYQDSASICIWGMAGVGKTSLAAKFCEELSYSYPDVQLYIDVKGNTSSPLNKLDVLNHIQKSFEPQAEKNSNSEDLSAIVRSILYKKKAIIFLDNVTSINQFSSLFPNKGNLLIVTSFNKVSFPGLHTLHLDPLQDDEAIQLIQKIVSIEKQEANKITKSCGNHPLAIRLSGNLLSENISISASYLINELSVLKKPWKFIEGPLTLIFDLLSEENRSLWTMLTTLSDQFSSRDASIIWDITLVEAELKLNLFVSNSLLNWNEREKLYFFHELVRDFATFNLTPELKTIAKDRMPSRKNIIITIESSGNKYMDVKRIRLIHDVLVDRDGHDTFTFRINESGNWYEIDFPHSSTDISLSLINNLKRILGEDNIEINSSDNS